MLVQLRVDEGEPALVDPLAGLDLRPLGEALSAVPLLLHGGVMDLQILHRVTGMRPSTVFDTQIAAGCAGDGYPVRLQELVRRHLDLRLPKTETLSDWAQRPLSPDQLRYAADDVLLLGPLARALEERLAARGNTEIAAACTAELVARALQPEDDTQAWRTVPGAWLLDDGERAVLQGLAAWRDREARARDLPRHGVVSDALLLDLSRRQPATIDALRANRRMPTQVWKKDGPAVLACIATSRGAAPPPALVPRPRPWSDLVLTAARVAEGKRGVSSELTLSDGVLARLASGEPLTDWRHAALGEEFFSFLQGNTTIVMPGDWVTRSIS